MKKFLTRVVLHDYASESDYDQLHELMRAQKFYKFIWDDETSKWYKLPPAEYLSWGKDINAENVIRFAHKAVSLTKKKYSILVVEYTGARWYNLEEVAGKPEL